MAPARGGGIALGRLLAPAPDWALDFRSTDDEDGGGDDVNAGGGERSDVPEPAK
jgi:hypothetical protein